ncbi:UPF0182 family protein [Actinophytocola gossypii]|uniref:UPF0182 protein JT362_34325 n=1 Tax=Actinophytocola gossypii TaxID=2812003 RepID=A0ABT2JJZ4_9PSEU|nr:UPF0182 family protein [Actinophytocola gossypii]MCT2588200.1 UPF0182 family protein [Actinophytocola gossypii]
MATRPPIGMPKLSRRAKILLSIAGALILLLLVGARLLDTYVDWLWFGEVGFRSVFTTVLLTRIVLFFAIAVLVGGLLAVSLTIAYRSRPVFVPVSGADDPLARYRSTIVQRVRLFGIGIPVVVGLIAGATGQADWQPVQLMLNGTAFGTTDPEFGKDIGFYAFSLPFITWLITWLYVAVIISLIGAVVTHYVFGGIRLGTRGDNFSVPARVQLSITAGVFVVILGIDYFFDRYELLFSNRNELFDGATYTDLNAVLPAKLILMFIAGFCAVAFFVGAFVRNLQLPAIAIVLLILSSILVGWAWPAVLEQFSVKPNAAEKEEESIERNLVATRNAFGLTEEHVEYTDYDGRPDGTADETAQLVREDTGTVPNLRLLDPNILSPTFTQRVSGENFYGFPEKLDIDRYEVDGKVQDYIVAVREINTNGLAENQRSWINQRMVYTHGNGFVAAPANKIDRAFNTEDSESAGSGNQGGYPVFEVSDVQALERDAEMNIPVEQPRVYYGELFADPDYAIVNARGEYDTPTDSNYSYEGAGGVPLDNFFDRFVFFAHYGERNILFNGDIDENSKIMYDRDPRHRVEKVAPWLTVDGDPYPAVVDGRIKWIVDGYTTLDNYPYSKQTPLGEATADALTGVARQEDRDISYIRNSVKAVVDAYDGTVTLHAIDDKDPVLRAWENVFPGTVSHELLNDTTGKFDELKSHFRYPEDMFKVQRELLQRYHVDNAQEFYRTQTFWDVAPDPTAGNASDANAAKQPPYYVLAQAPGQEEPTFQLQSAMTLLQRQFLAAWVSVSSDWDEYGKISVLRLPTTQGQTEGPVQVQNTFQTTDEFTQDRTLFGNTDVDVRNGNLLTLPVAGGLLYVEPIYIQRSDENAFPQLARVLVYFNDQVGYGSTIQEALADIFGEGAGQTAPAPEEEEQQPPEDGESPPPTQGQPPPPGGGGTDSELDQALQEASDAWDRWLAARDADNYAAEGEALADLEAAMAAIDQARGNGGG